MNESSCLFVKFVLYTGRVSWGGDPANSFISRKIRPRKKGRSLRAGPFGGFRKNYMFFGMVTGKVASRICHCVVIVTVTLNVLSL